MQSTKLKRRFVELAVVAIVMVILGWLLLNTHSIAPEEMARRRAIAEACLALVQSSISNEAEIQLDDPRIPDTIRAFHPVHIELTPSDVVVIRSGSPEEYHLSRGPDEPDTWILYAAGEGAGLGHLELLRIRSDQ